MTSHCCAHHSATSSVCQTLDEMAFERGLWSAALNNEIDRVSKLLADGKDVNGLDSAGYTALVCTLLPFRPNTELKLIASLLGSMIAYSVFYEVDVLVGMSACGSYYTSIPY